jgi:hypothetical protein
MMISTGQSYLYLKISHGELSYAYMAGKPV